jgi:hypothetical protein
MPSTTTLRVWFWLSLLLAVAFSVVLINASNPTPMTMIALLVAFGPALGLYLQLRRARALNWPQEHLQLDDFGTMVVFCGSPDNRGDQSALFQAEVDRQVTEEKSRARYFASVVTVWCLPDGQVHATLQNLSGGSEILWQEPHWSISAFRSVEPAARAMVQAALA